METAPTAARRSAGGRSPSFRYRTKWSRSSDIADDQVGFLICSQLLNNYSLTQHPKSWRFFGKHSLIHDWLRTFWMISAWYALCRRSGTMQVHV